ncbi:MAG: HlyD family type I secretion periplasmic adaptor subunit [Micavibrio sp.]|nr:MAG: HlyD family type I secretion periplasmic adaptor subunit [Micavibrio sp.]
MAKPELGYFSEMEEAARLKPHWTSTVLMLTIVAFVLWMIGWAAVAEVDERVRGLGRVMPSSDVQTVQSLEGGILSALLVQEGERVERGQVLMRIDDILFASEGRGIEAQLMSLQIRKARLEAEAEGRDFVLDEELRERMTLIAENEEKLYVSRKEELETALQIIAHEEAESRANLEEVRASINKLSQSRDSLRQELTIAEGLVARRAMPEIEKLRLERQYNETRGNLATAVQAREGLTARLNAVLQRREERLSAFRSQVLGELGETETRIAAISETLRSAEDRISRTELRAPVDGIVKRIALKTVGGVVEPAQRLIEIVPVEDELMIRSRVRPEDIAFLTPGQRVRVSITAYDAQIYGSLWGVLERIGADAVRESDGTMYFEIDVRTESNNLGTDDQPLYISPGMVAETEVITGKRTILSYLLKPVRRMADRAFTEP